MIIIGIDPGTAKVGFGIIRKNQDKLECLDYGIIQTESILSTEKRLKKIYLEILSLIKKWKPEVLAIENIYFFKNLKTAMPVSQAKGVILLAASQKKIPIFEITPLQVKTFVTGYGRADKKQVQKMIKILLNLKETPKPDDAADALGVAISCLQIIKKDNLITSGKSP